MNQSINTDNKDSEKPQHKYRLGKVSVKTNIKTMVQMAGQLIISLQKKRQLTSKQIDWKWNYM